MKEFDWLKNEMRDDMAEKLLSNLCTNSLVLSGFSFTSLAVFLGFYKDNLQQASTIIQYLIVATVFFFVVSELAREAHTVGEYLLSEGIYLASSILVFLTFMEFVARNLAFFGYPSLIILIVAIVLFALKLVWSAYIVLKRAVRSRKT